jgi:hypothetical protein
MCDEVKNPRTQYDSTEAAIIENTPEVRMLLANRSDFLRAKPRKAKQFGRSTRRECLKNTLLDPAPPFRRTGKHDLPCRKPPEQRKQVLKAKIIELIDLVGEQYGVGFNYAREQRLKRAMKTELMSRPIGAAHLICFQPDDTMFLSSQRIGESLRAHRLSLAGLGNECD